MVNEKRLIDAKCKDCIHHFVCETLKGKIENHWAETCVAYRHKKTCVDVVRCKDCKHRGDGENCPMCHEEWIEIDEGDGYSDSDFIIHDRTIDEGFCDRGEMDGDVNG